MSLDNASWFESDQTKKLLRLLDDKLAGFTLEKATMENLDGLKMAKQEILGVRTLVLSFDPEYKGRQ